MAVSADDGGDEPALVETDHWRADLRVPLTHVGAASRQTVRAQLPNALGTERAIEHAYSAKSSPPYSSSKRVSSHRRSRHSTRVEDVMAGHSSS
jgi:hypothetical protein